MNLLRTYLIRIALAWLGVLASVSAPLAQDETEASKDFLTNFLQEALSDAGREVSIDGFRGALSSVASADRISFADDEGVWLILQDVVLDWDRGALFGGRLQINELSAAELRIARLPATGDDAPTPEAGEFRLPDLPVAVNIAAMRLDRIDLGAKVLGKPAILTAEGSLNLQNRGGRVAFLATRLDEVQGRFELAGAYDPDENTLSVLLELQESASGIAAAALNVPGRPSVALRVAGEGPVEAFTADILLATDDQTRVSGTAGIAADAQGQRAYTLDIVGDLTALLEEGEAAFLGGESRLSALGLQSPDGELRLDRFDLDTQFADVQGSGKITANGWPAQLSISGALRDRDGDPVQLPGADVSLQSAQIDLTFDASKGDAWQGQVDLLGLQHISGRLEALSLTGQGTVTQADLDTPGTFFGTLDLNATGIALVDPVLARTLGTKLKGQLSLSGIEGAPLQFSDLQLLAGDLAITGSARVLGFATGFLTSLSLGLETPRLDRFAEISGLAGLSGSGKINVNGDVVPLSGAFELRIDAQTTPLKLGVSQADAVLQGETTLMALVKRGKTGILIEQINVNNAALLLSASGRVASEELRLDYDLRLKDLARLHSVDAMGRGQAQLVGVLRADALGAVQHLEAKGDVFAAEGKTVLIPLGDSTVEMRQADINLGYQVDSKRWSLVLNAKGLDQATATVDRLNVELAGLLRHNAAGKPIGTRATFAAFARGVESRDSKIAELLGQTIKLTSDLNFERGAPLHFSNGRLLANGFQVQADGVYQGGTANELQTALTVIADSLAPISGLLGTQIRGAGKIETEITVGFTTGNIAAKADATLDNLRIGPAALDPLLAGATRIETQVTRQNGKLGVQQLTLQNSNLTGRASGDLNVGFDVDVTLRDVAVLAGGTTGPLNVSGRIVPQGQAWQLNLTGDGPGGSDARLDGTVVPGAGGTTGNLRVLGTLPLGLANPYIAPRRLAGTGVFDLAVNGPITLANATGALRISDATLSAPTAQFSLNKIAGDIALAAGRATVAVRANAAQGGELVATGGISLDGSPNADVRLELDQVQLRKDDLLKTSASGTIVFRGPLSGGAALTGTIRLGVTDIVVAPTGITALGAIPDIRHINSSATAAQTRARAGIIGAAANNTGDGSGPSYPVDLRIEAPGRVFVRGRGLDAELGGTLRLVGTTQALTPQGRFDLIRGRLDILTQRFQLTEGSAQLIGNFDPFLRLSATTQKDGTTVSVIVQGSASAPEVRFASTPELPEDEVLALLIFGRALSKLSPFQALELASAVATLAGVGGVGVLQKLRQNFGLDDLDLTSDENGETAVRAGKYISENVYTDVTVGSKGKAKVKLNIDLSPNVTGRGSFSSDGETGLGIFFEKDY